jgi:sialate O-acetylesterase
MKNKTSFLLLLFCFCTYHLSATLVLSNIFKDHMVLQRNSDVTIWGWGDLNETVTVITSWDNKEYKTEVSLTAKWQLQVNTPEAGGPFTIQFKGESNEIILKDILIGEVWLCSGQSNMEWSANNGIDDAEEEIENANYPNIRFFTVLKRTSETEQDQVYGKWETCIPETMRYFSATGYFFARKLQKELDIPIGIIDTGWGATSSEVWTPKSVFDANEQLKAQATKINENIWAPVQPSILYNGMISPITDFKIAGTLWYQGESNVANAESYEKLFSSMISSWRASWGYDFPFYYVQIAPYKYGTPEKGVHIRDAQRRALKVPNTGMVVVSDICTIDDIHPTNKQDVGLRLANIALRQEYRSLDGIVNGPLFKAFRVSGKKLEVIFENADGLHFVDKQRTDFEVAGDDGQFYPAKARIKNDTILVSSDKVEEPKRVRYAWSNTALANLFNSAGLPASSFISD